MKLIAQVRLFPDGQQRIALKQTLETANTACDYISEQAWQSQTFRRYDLQNLAYYDVRERFKLAAQMTIRCLAKVADAYTLDRKTQRSFKPLGAIAYDDRILSWEHDNQTVSIWTIDGRQRMSYGAGERQQHYLQFRQGETDLVFFNGMYFLLAVCDIPDPEEQEVADALGVDLGVTNIATTSDGDIQSSAAIERNRRRMATLRGELQTRGSLSAKRHLRKLAGRQKRFQKDTNHVISKRLVETAEHTNRAIALEELTHIRTRTRVRGRDQRARHSNWAFAQLRQFIDYKARMVGIPVILVDPRYTSQRCFVCSHTEKANRRSQDTFLCCACGHLSHADVNAAKNIALRAAVNPPIVSDAPQNVVDAVPETSPPALAVGR